MPSMIYAGDFELLPSKFQDVSCPECGATWEIEDYPEYAALISAPFECDHCNTKLTIEMVLTPHFTVTHRGE